MSKCRSGRGCKNFENVFRCVNISLVNELKCVFDALDIDFGMLLKRHLLSLLVSCLFSWAGYRWSLYSCRPFISLGLLKEKNSNAFISLAGEINDAILRLYF